ncbi:MAG: biotin--[acetyl-CoA-carboxylase] ligase [Pseudomonadales bacterium]
MISQSADDIVLLSGVLDGFRSLDKLPLAQWPEHVCSPEEVGLVSAEGSVQLPNTAEPLTASCLQSLQSFPGARVTVVSATHSTNSDLMREAVNGSVRGRLHVAEHQAGGRGRRGRQWISPFARCIAMSVGICTTRPVLAMQGLGLVTGIAVCHTLRSLGAVSIGLKWPNDLVVEGRKVAGILVEHQQFGDESRFVVGVGVNVALSDLEISSIPQPVTDLRRLGVSASRVDIVKNMAQFINEGAALLEAHGFEPFRDRFRELHVLHESECVVLGAGVETHGRVVDVGASGELILDTGSGRRAFVSGEVSLRRSEQ